MRIQLNRKHIIIVLLAILTTIMMLLVEPFITKKIHVFDTSIELGVSGNTYTVELEPNSVLRQTFSMPFDYFSGVNLTFYNAYVYSDGLVKVSVVDNEGNTIAQWESISGMVEHGLPHKCRINPIKVEKGSIYSIVIQNLDSSQIRCKASEDNTYDGGEMSIDGEAIGDVDAVIYGRNESASSTTFFTIVFFLIAVLVIWGYINQFFVNPSDSDAVTKENRIIWIASVGVLIWLYAFTISQYGDLDITILHSKELLSCIHHGNFREFYDITWEKALIGDYIGKAPTYSAYYNILLYLALAIIILPLRLVEFVFVNTSFSHLFYIMWVEFFICVILSISSKIVENICAIYVEKKEVCKLVVIFYLTSAVTLFSTVGFGQLDIIPVTIMLLGVQKYLEKKNVLFVFFFSVAISMKTLAILVFVPLVLVRYKRVIKAFVILCGGMVLTLGSSMIFSSTPGYIITKATLNDHYKFVESLFGANFPVGVGPVSYFVLFYLAVCVGAYKCNEDNYLSTLKYSMLGLTPFFLFVTWHPQWLSLIMPFLCLGLPFVWHEAVAVHCIIFMGIFYWANVNFDYPKNVDNFMINRGILPLITKHMYEGVTVKDILGSINGCLAIVTSAFFILLSVYVFMCIREIGKAKVGGKIDCKNTWAFTENIFVSFCLILVYYYLYFFIS